MEAFEKTQLTLTITGHEWHVRNCGLSLVVMLPVLLCCACCSLVGGKPESCLLGTCGCNRFCWLIIGPIMLTSLAEMQSAVNANLSVADEFTLINECADVKAFVDGDELRAIQEENIDKINSLFNMCIAAFGMMAVEVLMCCCAVCITAMGNSSCSRNFSEAGDFCNEAGFFMGLTKYG